MNIGYGSRIYHFLSAADTMRAKFCTIFKKMFIYVLLYEIFVNVRFKTYKFVGFFVTNFAQKFKVIS